MTVARTKSGLRLGLRTLRPKPITFLMSKYVDTSKLPPVPKSFGHFDKLGKDWGMLGNDSAGDCFWAGTCHAAMLWNAVAGKTARFTDASALRTYSEATGYDPSKTDSAGDNPTDNGTDMAEGCEFWKTRGVLDADGNRHKIEAYLAIDPADPAQRFAATYLFGALMLGIDLPQSAEDQFDRGRPWTYVPGSPSLGGHLVLSVGHRDGVEQLCSWGRVQPASTYFVERRAIQGAAIVTTENLVSGKSPEGFDSASLMRDLATLGGN